MAGNHGEKQLAPCLLLIICLILPLASGAEDACRSSDANLLRRRGAICASPGLAGCPAANVTVRHDWPNQVVYMGDLLATLADPSTCLNTTLARDTVSMLEITDLASSPWWHTWLVFQPQYYEMPRTSGAGCKGSTASTCRIESPATLGRKCWAFAYLRQIWTPLKPVIERAAADAGLSLRSFITAFDNAVPYTFGLCQKVMANCFVNATYDPVARNGTCSPRIGQFYVGFQWENAIRGGTGTAWDHHTCGDFPNAGQPNVVAYPFSMYNLTLNQTFRSDVMFAVDAVLNYIN